MVINMLYIKAGKRLLDIILATLFIAIILPYIYILIAIAVKLDSRGRILFTQERTGLGGGKFRLMKFRTLFEGDHTLNRKGQYREVVPGDHNITKVGIFLRKTGLDELPQMINIIAGQMSLVGPRPYPTAMDREMSENILNYFERYRVKPGLTGWAQVNGLRGPATNPAVMRHRIKYDIWYMRHQSFRLDLLIIVLGVKQFICHLLVRK